MSKEQIVEKLKEIFQLVAHNGVDVNVIEASSNIRLDLGVNSVALVYMMIAIERSFGIDMRDVTANTFTTVEDVVDYIYERVK